MNTKKKFIKIFMSIILFISIILGCGYIFYRFYITNNNDIFIDNPSPVSAPQSPETSESDFVFEKSKITFSKYQKLRILSFEDNNLFINIQEFKYYFLVEFNKLGPKNENINITFKFDDAFKPVKASVIYENNALHIWNYIIKHI